MERIRQPRFQALTWLTLALLSLAGCAAIWYATRWGPWVNSDASGYLGIVRNILAGRGIGLIRPDGSLAPLTLQAPFYSILLSGISLTGVDVVDGARWLNILLFGLMVFSAGGWMFHLTNSFWPALALSTLILAIPHFSDIFSGAMSEPFFYLTGINGLFLAIESTRTGRLNWLVLAGTLCALSTVTRYAGAGWAAAGVFGLLILGGESFSIRLKNALVFTMVSLLPLVLWLVYSSLAYPGEPSRLAVQSQNVLALAGTARLQILQSVWGWLTPVLFLPPYSYNTARNFAVIVTLIILLITLAAQFISSRQPGTDGSRGILRFSLVWLAFAGAYLFLVTAGFVFTTPQPDLIDRTLMPAGLGLLVFLLFWLFYLARILRLPAWGRGVPFLLITLTSLAYLPLTVNQLENLHRDGRGYTGTVWRTSPTIEALQAIPISTPLITNEPAAVMFLTGRSPYTVMEIYSTKPLETYTRYGDNPAEKGQAIFKENGAALILFNNILYQLYDLYGLQTEQRVQALTRGLDLTFESYDGRIYYYPSAQ